MSAYSAVRVGKLRLKGPASGALKGKKRRKRKRESQEEVNEEDLRHGVFPIMRSSPNALCDVSSVQEVGEESTKRRRLEEGCYC